MTWSCCFFFLNASCIHGHCFHRLAFSFIAVIPVCCVVQENLSAGSVRGNVDWNIHHSNCELNRKGFFVLFCFVLRVFSGIILSGIILVEACYCTNKISCREEPFLCHSILNGLSLLFPTFVTIIFQTFLHVQYKGRDIVWGFSFRWLGEVMTHICKLWDVQLPAGRGVPSPPSALLSCVWDDVGMSSIVNVPQHP